MSGADLKGGGPIAWDRVRALLVAGYGVAGKGGIPRRHQCDGCEFGKFAGGDGLRCQRFDFPVDSAGGCHQFLARAK